MFIFAVSPATDPVGNDPMAVVNARDAFEARQKVRKHYGLADRIQLRVSTLIADGPVMSWRAD